MPADESKSLFGDSKAKDKNPKNTKNSQTSILPSTLPSTLSSAIDTLTSRDEATQHTVQVSDCQGKDSKKREKKDKKLKGDKKLKKSKKNHSSQEIVNSPKDSNFSETRNSTTSEILNSTSNIDDSTNKDLEKFYRKHEIQSTREGKDFVIDPIYKFATKNLLPLSILECLSAFKAPTPVQALSWPVLINKMDLIAISKTGSGKTMAFGIPAILTLNSIKAENHSIGLVNSKKEEKAPRVLVLSPTRELAIQIHEQFLIFAKTFSTTCIYGGVSKQSQKTDLKRGVDCIIATPGRLIDLFEENDKLCDLSQVQYLVLDEADRMLDAGFEDAIKKIIAKLPATTQRQTVMFSATWPPSIQRMANMYLNNPVKITVGSTELSANTSIEQRVEVIDQSQKEGRLTALLKKYHTGKNRILIFALYKKEASRILGNLSRAGYKVAAIHGDMSQSDRSSSLDSFRSGLTPLLVATDVAARGIDIPNVEYVINVTFPLTVEDYCHRIGRTGRAGAKGISHTLFTVLDKALSGSLINVLKKAGQSVPDELMAFGTTVKRKVDPNYGVFARDVDMSLKGSKITFDDPDSDS